MLEASGVLEGWVCAGAAGELDSVVVLVYEAETVRETVRLVGAAGTDGRLGVARHVVLGDVTGREVACAAFILSGCGEEKGCRNSEKNRLC